MKQGGEARETESWRRRAEKKKHYHLSPPHPLCQITVVGMGALGKWEEDQTPGRHCPPPPSLLESTAQLPGTGQNHKLQRFILAVQGLYLEEGLARGGREES